MNHKNEFCEEQIKQNINLNKLIENIKKETSKCLNQ